MLFRVTLRFTAKTRKQPNDIRGTAIAFFQLQVSDWPHAC